MFRSFFTLMLLGFMTANLAMAVTSPPVQSDTAFFCEQNYNNASSARHTCQNESFSTVDSTKARLEATCETNMANQFKGTGITLDATLCGDLENCNGTLQLDNC